MLFRSLALAARGRVRFYEPDEYLLWQGEPHRYHVFVIQQGTVSLWEDDGGRSTLRDVRGAGDMLGIERYYGAPHCEYSVRSGSDVIIYSFPEEDFSQFVLKYPHAAEYVAAEGRVTADYQGAAARREPHRTFLHSIVGQRPLLTCRDADTVAGVAGRLLTSRADAVALLDDHDRLRGVLTSDTLLRWIANGGGDAATEHVGTLVSHPPAVVSPNAWMSAGVIAMGESPDNAVAITEIGRAHV